MLLDPSFPVNGSDFDDMRCPPTAELPKAFSGEYKHAALLSQAAEMFAAAGPERAASPSQAGYKSTAVLVLLIRCFAAA